MFLVTALLLTFLLWSVKGKSKAKAVGCFPVWMWLLCAKNIIHWKSTTLWVFHYLKQRKGLICISKSLLQTIGENVSIKWMRKSCFAQLWERRRTISQTISNCCKTLWGGKWGRTAIRSTTTLYHKIWLSLLCVWNLNIRASLTWFNLRMVYGSGLKKWHFKNGQGDQK